MMRQSTVRAVILATLAVSMAAAPAAAAASTGSSAATSRTYAMDRWNQRGVFAAEHGSIRPRYFGGKTVVNLFVNCSWTAWGRSGAYGSGRTDKGDQLAHLHLYDARHSARWGWYFYKLHVSGSFGSGTEHWSFAHGGDWVG
jgi:hypothetical protein